VKGKTAPLRSDPLAERRQLSREISGRANELTIVKSPRKLIFRARWESGVVRGELCDMRPVLLSWFNHKTWKSELQRCPVGITLRVLTSVLCPGIGLGGRPRIH